MKAKEKMTAPIASVGADVEQPSSNKLTNQSIADLPGKGNLQATNNAENTAKSANKNNPDNLETVSMMELYDTAYPPKLPIIDGLLYNGTYLFVGSPKIGKSFFMAQIGYHISKGFPLWGFSVRQGTVLYLALEDDYARLQKRLSQMFGMEGSENFYFATKSKSLNDGLESYHAVVAEQVAKMAFISFSVNPNTTMNPLLVEKHFNRIQTRAESVRPGKAMVTVTQPPASSRTGEIGSL